MCMQARLIIKHHDGACLPGSRAGGAAVMFRCFWLRLARAAGAAVVNRQEQNPCWACQGTELCVLNHLAAACTVQEHLCAVML